MCNSINIDYLIKDQYNVHSVVYNKAMYLVLFEIRILILRLQKTNKMQRYESCV